MLLILCVADVSLHRITLRLSFVPNGLESITRAQTHWLGPTRSVICRSAFESAQRAQRDFRMIQFELASEINDVQAADTVEFAKQGRVIAIISGYYLVALLHLLLRHWNQHIFT